MRGRSQGQRGKPASARSGAVKILQLTSPTAYCAEGATGKTRLAWTVIGKLPVVQCIEVQRAGNFLTGIHVQLLSLSAPIPAKGSARRTQKRGRRTVVELGDARPSAPLPDEAGLLESVARHGRFDSNQAAGKRPPGWRLASSTAPAPLWPRAGRRSTAAAASPSASTSTPASCVSRWPAPARCSI